MSAKKTAGELALQASRDETRYDLLEVGEALASDILKQVWDCVDRHYNIIDEPEFCVVLVRAGDPLITNLIRKKFYAWPFLPSPRPEQTVFHYSKVNDDICRLWSLPSAKVMATISEMTNVDKQWKLTKFWCDSFYAGKLFENIRHQHDITLQSESEFLESNRDKLIKAGCKPLDSSFTKPFDFGKVMPKGSQVIDPIDPLFSQEVVKSSSKTKDTDRHVQFQK